MLAFFLACSAPQRRETSNAPARPTAVDAPDGGSDEIPDRVWLMVRKDVIVACPKLDALSKQPRDVAEGKTWRAMLDQLSHCLLAGDLMGRTVVLRGPQGASDLARGILTDSGVDDSRIIVIPTAEAGALVEVSLDPLAPGAIPRAPTRE